MCLFLVVNQIMTQDPASGECRLWGDPHLLMFPVHESQTDMRAIYWCQSPGRMLFLKNKFIEIYVDVATYPYSNENVSRVFRFFLNPYYSFLSSKSSCSAVLMLFVQLPLIKLCAPLTVSTVS